MRLFIDGYNVIFASTKHAFNMDNPERARMQLISLLSAYRSITRDEITVAFDGHADGRMYPQTQKVHGITIVFSEADADADTLIKRLLAKEPNPKAAAVVSSDNSLRDFAKRLRAGQIDSEEFLRELDKRLKSAHAERADNDPIEKYEGLSRSEVDYWMKYFGFGAGGKK
ncbi:MAG: NYN domain-containing protein [Planctomycetota bacterium]